MRERHLTAAMMALSNTLFRLDISQAKQDEFLSAFETELSSLLKGEEGYAGTRLTGDDNVALLWNDGVLRFLKQYEYEDIKTGYQE